MSNIVDFSTSNSQVSDEIINVSDSNPVNLQHDIFYNKTGKKVVIRTAASGGGTLLTETTDYTIGGSVSNDLFPSSISPDVGYTTVAITNATYQSTDLYVSYYPLVGVFKASRWNELFNPESVGDFDISASDQTYNMKTINSYPIGTIRRVSWYDGDGSNDFQFVDSSASITLNGTAITGWVGEGTGYLDIVKTASDTWLSINDGVYDSDGGNFTNWIWNKTTDGSLWQNGLLASFSSGSTVTLPLSYASTSYVATIGVERVETASSCLELSSKAVNSFDAILRNSAGTSVTADYLSVITNGRWTTSYPRKS